MKWENFLIYTGDQVDILVLPAALYALTSFQKHNYPIIFPLAFHSSFDSTWIAVSSFDPIPPFSVIRLCT